MRVTQQMLTNNMQRNISNNLSRINNLQEQLASGRVLNKPSDDPVALHQSMLYRSELATTEQFQRNVDLASTWVDMTDTAVDQSVNVIHRVRELATQGANGTNSQSEREAIAAEVEELTKQLREVANTKFNGKYIFNGERTDQPPYPKSNSYQAESFDKGSVVFELARGINVEVNVHAGEIFGEQGQNVFKTLNEVSTALRSGDSDSLQTQIGNLENDLDRMLQGWASVGAKGSRVELIDKRLDDSNFNLQTLISKTEDADMAALITNLRTEENVYEASLAASAKLIQPTLLDFLR
jgi:flagellar hook-associated protein 3 FlgL